MLKILDALDLTWSITMGYPTTGQKNKRNQSGAPLVYSSTAIGIMRVQLRLTWRVGDFVGWGNRKSIGIEKNEQRREGEGGL